MKWISEYSVIEIIIKWVNNKIIDLWIRIILAILDVVSKILDNKIYDNKMLDNNIYISEWCLFCVWDLW